MRKRKGRRSIGSTRCTTRCIGGRSGLCLRTLFPANKGAAGVDGQTFEDIELYGLDRWLGNWRKN